MKKLLKLALVGAAIAGISKLATAKKAEWSGLTESQVREKLDSGLPSMMPDEKRSAVADQVVSKMRDRGVLREQDEATSSAAAGNGGPSAEATAGHESDEGAGSA